jgi:Winged helix DNA-binding domain
VDAEQVLAFRLARLRLASRAARTFAEAAACPASDFARDAALLALAARHEPTTRTAYDEAVDGGELGLAHVVRGAIHAFAPEDFALYGRALISSDDDELAAQLGRQVRRLVGEKGLAPNEALDEVAEATEDALRDGRALTKDELHDELRERVRADLLPWCESCKSHHVPPRLWRYAGVKAGARLDAHRRYLLGKRGRSPAAAEAVKRFLHFYGPADAGDFAEWSGVAGPHAKRLFKEIEGDLTEVSIGGPKAWALSEDLSDLESPPGAKGVRFIPAGDPYLQKPNRPLLAPEAELRKRLFRPVASPGAVLNDGRLVGLWRVKTKGKKAEITVEKLRRIARKGLEEEARRVAELRGASGVQLIVD